MKTFAANEKRSAPSVSRSHLYVHHPMGPVQQGQQAAMRKILQPDEVQAKPDFGENDGKYQQEADHVVEDLLVPAISGMPPGVPGGAPIQRSENEEPERELQRQSEDEEEEELQAKFVDEHIQRQPIEEEEEELQAKEQPGQTPQVGSGVESRINSLKCGGQPLDPPTRSFFEPRFRHDFSHVRVHADNDASEAAKSVNARAFTLGNNVVFGSWLYQPKSKEGKRLLGHELTHVVQQTGGIRALAIQRREIPLDLQTSVDLSSMTDEELRHRYNRIVETLLLFDHTTPETSLLQEEVKQIEILVFQRWPITFYVNTTNLTPKRWADRGNINAGAANTWTNITIGGPLNSTIDITHVRKNAPDFGHTHTDPPAGARRRRFKHGHLTNRANGQGRQFNDFQINARGDMRTITYHAPHAAGQVLLTAQIRGRAYTAAQQQVTVTTEVTGLQQYTIVHPNEVLIGLDPQHGTNHWGTAAAIARMQQIVNDFRNGWVMAAAPAIVRNPDDAPTIRINDFSLQHGGLYDFRDNWYEPHRTHRFGNDIDISRNVLIGGLMTWLRPGHDAIGMLYDLLNTAIGVNPEDAAHWHVDA